MSEPYVLLAAVMRDGSVRLFRREEERETCTSWAQETDVVTGRSGVLLDEKLQKLCHVTSPGPWYARQIPELYPYLLGMKVTDMDETIKEPHEELIEAIKSTEPIEALEDFSIKHHLTASPQDIIAIAKMVCKAADVVCPIIENC